MSRRQQIRPPRPRSSRDGYWRRMSWQEVEEAFNHLFEVGCDNEQARRYAHRFRRARSQVSSLFLHMMASDDPGERQVAAFVLAEIGGKQVIRSLQEMFLDPSIGEFRRSEVADLLRHLGASLPEETKPTPLGEPEKASAQRKLARSRSAERKAGKTVPEPPKPSPAPLPEPTEAGDPTSETRALCQKESREILAALEEDRILKRTLEALPHLPGPQQKEFLEKIGQPGALPALRLLLPLLQGDNWTLIELALTAVERVGLTEAIPAVQEVAERSPRKRLKVRARRILREMRLKVPPPLPEGEPSAGPEEVLGPLYRAYATTVRGDGTQTLLVAREQLEGGLKLLRLRHNDEEGLLECTFEAPLTRPALRALLGQLRSQGEWPVEVPLRYCDQMLITAVNLARRRKRPLPAEYQAAQRFCGTRRSSSQVALKLDPAPQIDRLGETPQLMDRPEFQSWGFDVSRYPTLLQRWEQAQGCPTASRHRQDAITHLIRAEVDEGFLSRLRTRLQRQALLLQRMKETEAAEWACIAAAGLLKKFNLLVEEHPLLRAMAASSFQRVLGREEGVEQPEPPSEELEAPLPPDTSSCLPSSAELVSEPETEEQPLARMPTEEKRAAVEPPEPVSRETPATPSPLWPKSGRRRWAYSSHSRSRRLR